jgi:MFS family permease
VDTTIVVLALPEIERDLHVPLASVIWVIIGYLLVITVLATQVGRLGDMFGRVRMYAAGFLIFVLGSLACALAGNDASIIGFRILQGIGGAFVSFGLSAEPLRLGLGRRPAEAEEAQAPAVVICG